MNYIIGNDNYNYYKSSDDGVNWSFLKEGNGDAIVHKGRIIIYSKENKGLKYTDDNFSTINDSNILDGSWQSLENNELEEIYATSLDGKGIYYSKNNGESWERISAGSGNKITVTDDKIYIYGPDEKQKNDVVEIPRDGGPLIYYPDSIFSNGKIIQNYINEEPLIYILNKIVIPKLCSTLTGYESLKDLNGFYNNEKAYNSYYTDGEIYKVKTDGIDFAADVGMMPLKKEDINEYQKAKQELEDIVISYDNDNKEIRLLKELENEESKLSKTFEIIDNLLGVFELAFTVDNDKKIREKKEDYDGLDSPVNREALSDYYKMSKAAEISVSGIIIHSIFSFSHSKKMALLKTSIMETANSLKGKINTEINIAKQLLSEESMEKEGFVPKYTTEEVIKKVNLNFSLREAWKASIKRCIVDYYNVSRRNIINISKSNDKEFISEAANEYSSIRLDLIDAVKTIVNNSVPTNFGLVDNTNRNTLLDTLSSNLYDKIEKLKNHQITEEEFNNELSELLNIFKEEENNIHTKELPLYTCLADNYYNNFLNDLKNTSFDSLQVSTFSPETFEEFKAAYNPADINKIYNYYDQIIIEFRNRCALLLKIIIDNLLHNENPDLNYINAIDNYNKVEQYIQDLKAAKNKSDYYNANPLDTFKYKKNPEFEFIFMIRKSWNNMRNKI